MPRQVNRQRTTRTSVQEQSGGNPFSIVAPSHVNVSQDANYAAAALVGLTKLGSQAYTEYKIKKDEADFQKGAQDATLGKVDEKLAAKSAAYAKARDQVGAKASWAVDVTEFEQAIGKLDLDSMDPDEAQVTLNQALDQLFADKYDGENRQNVLEYLVPAMQEYRALKNAEFAQMQQQKVEEQISADLSIATEASYENFQKARAADPTVKFDYQSLNDEINALRDGPAVPEEMFGILKDLAIKNGDPALLLNLPDKWANGLDTFKHIPRFKDAYREAVFAAQRQADANETALEKALKDENDENLRVAELGIAQAIMAGVDPQPMLDAYLSMPGAEGKDALSMDSSWRSARDDIEERDGDFTKTAELERDIVYGTAGLSDLFAAYASGTLGSGKKAKQEFSRLVNVVTEQMRYFRGERDNRTDNYRSEVRTRFQPLSAPGVPPSPAAVQKQADAIAYYNRLVFEQDVDPLEAVDKTTEQFGGEKSGPVIDRRTPLQQVRDVAGGKGTIAELKAAGITVKKIDEMAKAKQITPEEAQKLLAGWPQ